MTSSNQSAKQSSKPNNKQDKILITGADGFVGTHLVKYLLESGYQAVHGTYFRHGADLQSQVGNEQAHQVNLEDPAAVGELLNKIQPDWIIHLAARSIVQDSFDKAWLVLETNARLQLVMLDAVRQFTPKSRMLCVGSAHAYGILPPKYQNKPLDEETPFYPDNPYSVSKLTQEYLSRSYQLSYDLDIVFARPFNMIGPGQTTNFAIPSFAQQIAAVENGQQTSIEVGNLSAIRDFTDVRDAVCAIEVIMQHAPSGEVYNLGSGFGVSMQEVLDELIALSDQPIKVEVDPARLRPSDVPFFVADNTKLRNLGWEPKIQLRQTLQDILNQQRTEIKQQ